MNKSLNNILLTSEFKECESENKPSRLYKNSDTIDVLLLLNLEIREALFMNLVQTKSEQLEPIMRNKAVVPSGLCYMLDPLVLREERMSEAAAATIQRHALSDTQRQNYMDKFAPTSHFNAEKFYRQQ